jgi:hypothetical protein
MTIAVKRLLSGSTDGKGIKVVATTSPGTLIHTAITGTTAGTYDEVWLWAYNADTANMVIYIEIGDSTLPRKITIPLQSGLVPLLPGLLLQNAQTIKVYATGTNLIMLDGFVNRIADTT